MNRHQRGIAALARIRSGEADDDATAGAIITPGDVQARITQADGYITSLDHAIHGAYLASPPTMTDRAFLRAWADWFATWQNWRDENSSALTGMFGGTEEVLDEWLRQAQDWRLRAEARGLPGSAVPTPPPASGPAVHPGVDTGILGETSKTVLIVGGVIAGLVVLYAVATR